MSIEQNRPEAQPGVEDECPLHIRVFKIRLATEAEIQQVLDCNGVGSEPKKNVCRMVLSLFLDRNEITRAEMERYRTEAGIGAHLASMRNTVNLKPKMQKAGLRVDVLSARMQGERWVINFVGDPKRVRRASREEIEQLLAQPSIVQRSGLVDVAMPLLRPKGYIEEHRVRDAWNELDEGHAYARGNLVSAAPLRKAQVYIDTSENSRSGKSFLIARSEKVLLTKDPSGEMMKLHGQDIKELINDFPLSQRNLLLILMRQKGSASLERLQALCRKGESVLTMIEAINEKLQECGRRIYVRRNIAIIGFSDPAKEIVLYKEQRK